MHMKRKVAQALGWMVSLTLFALSARAQPIGQWDFESGHLDATLGSPLLYLDGSGGATEMGTTFGTTTYFGIPDINGAVAKVMRFPANTAPSGYYLPAPSGNGGGNLVNQWTLIMDVLWPAGSASQLRALIETDNRIVTADADLFVSAAGGLGVSGQFDGQILVNTWYRIGFVVDTPNNQLRKYINGILVGTQVATSGDTPAIDGRWALDPLSGAELFNDDDGQAAPGYVNSIQLRNVALTSAQMAAYGGPQASGISQIVPAVPSYLESWIPSTPSANAGTYVGAVINAGDATLSAWALTLDGVAKVPAFTQVGSVYTIKVTSFGLDLLQDHTIVISYTDSLTGTKTFTHSFRVAAFFEDFEGLALKPSVDERIPGTDVWTDVPPADWTLDDSGVPGSGDLGTDGVTEWAGWGFADRDWWVTTAGDQTRGQFLRANGTVAIADPDEWDDQSHPAGLYNALMTTPPIPVQWLPANTLFLQFDSSWRPECCDSQFGLPNDQTASIVASFDGGPGIEVLRWSSNPSLPNFHDDAQNEQVTVLLANPAGATKLALTFGLLNAENDWWWAIDNIVVSAFNTLLGQDVVVSLADSVEITFGNVLKAGDTVASQVFNAPPLPPNFQFGTPPSSWDITTTALFSGPVEVCLGYDESTFANENGIKLLHHEGGAWVDVTSSLDVGANQVCGVVSSLSPFAVVEPVPGPRLRITRTATDVLCSWPAPSTGFVLEESDTLVEADWTTVGTPPAQVADQNVVTLQIEGGMKFFRLKRP
jgi:hypothetical protein